MKRIISVLVTLIMASSYSAPFVFAENGRYTATDSGFVSAGEFATREQAVACFIKAVGIERFKTDRAILDKFSDSTRISFAYIDAMSAAVYSGLISGYEDRTLRPQSQITRAEALVILGRALSRTELADNRTVEFSDTPEWAEKQIGRLASAGIVKGYGDGKLGARDLLTIEQVNTLCERITRCTGAMGDYYTFVNSAWLDSTPIDDGVSVWSDMDKLSQTVDSRISDIIFSLYRRYYNDGEQFAEDSNEKKIINVYSAAANQSYRDKTGLKPIREFLDEIAAAKTAAELLNVTAKLEQAGFPTMLTVGAETDPHSPSVYMPAFSGAYTGVKRTLFDGKDAEIYINAYKDYISRLFVISGEEQSEADKNAGLAAELCIKLAKAMNPGDDSSISSSVKAYPIEELKSIFTGFDIQAYLADVGFAKAENVLVYSASLAEAVNSVMTDSGAETVRAYLAASVLDSSAMYLTSDTFAAYCDFRNTLSGSSAALIPSDYAVAVVQELLGRELGAMYIDIYFLKNIKNDILDMTGKITDEYERLIKSCTRMTPATRERAVRKLKSLRVNAAYPEDITEYRNDSYVIRPTDEGGSLMEYKIEAARAGNRYLTELVSSGAKADNEGWSIYPQTVNAMYDPVSNSITIPAGILQAPFFDQYASFEQNLGGIGFIIAHEISHAFDSVGAQFDENGALKNWWSEQDYSAFEQLCAKTVEQYGAIKTENGQVNGRLTLDENLADIAAMSCVLGLAGKDNPRLGELFEAYARTWRTKTTAAYGKMLLKSDEHAPAKVRVNRVLSNFEEFQDLYGVIDGDGMYLPEESRIEFWK